MQPPAQSEQHSPLDLELLEIDTHPIFVVRIAESALPFEFVYCNEAFHREQLREPILANTKESLLFRSWAQAWSSERKSQHTFIDRMWSSSFNGTPGRLKMIRATALISEGEEQRDQHELLNAPETLALPLAVNITAVRKSSRESPGDVARKEMPALQRSLPRTNLDARWEGLQTMMEMSDVGVFEYNTEGKLLHANDAWYRLSSHPRDLPAHVQFSFMDLVYPSDQALVLTMWNTLSRGTPVTFEMRWKSSDGSNQAGQWVLSACVPIFDDDGKLISIAGNTIDINAQKKSQEVAQAQVEALEQARLSELKFANFAQLSPTAIYIFVPETGMQYVNDQFFELTGRSRAAIEQFEWTSLVAAEDAERVEEEWKALLKGKKTDGVQFRLKKTWINQDGHRSNIWVQSTSSPQLDKDGQVISIMGTLFDISQFKWAESVQLRRVEEALEAKRQQENFIDMTSHELRNPLSAVLQCAESVIANLEHLTWQLSTNSPAKEDFEKVREELDASIDALHTIVSCSMHQKRVIDDVLTLSKLDSKLIVITPIKVQPEAIVLDALKMFEVECRKMEIQLDFAQDDTFAGFEWVMLDPSRLLQVLINLITNAIKFTKDRPERRISVKLGGSWERPPQMWQAVSFKTEEKSQDDILDKPDWGHGKKAYIWIQVTDTGCGMTEAEQKRLFSRFTQATPKTHVRYGGSGLGLFISKALTNLQGGLIGVSSQVKKGSTFTFFVSTRLVDPPDAAASGRQATMRPSSRRTISSEDAMKAVKLHVLIVEDNLVNQKVLKKQLQKLGWKVSVAGDGTEAIEWLKRSMYWQGPRDKGSSLEQESHGDFEYCQEPLDLILMDIEMPQMDGLTCTRLIRGYEDEGLIRRPTFPPLQRASTLNCPSSTSDTLDSTEGSQRQKMRLPILAVSANARMEQIKQALAAGMDDAISKPFRIPELWPKIRGVIPRLAGTSSGIQ
ncbi:hypothetical protein FB567DRAFT_214123 [Paraphoma chrysanthemicola]|uniref:Uncharacterized protein n=1 Tax=Paraphoma chrysanthemicola TaxID=798071 RepID=A0A8K0QU79_9PLEO|nr:hypothetical protein FB567DRAFT_214123 [Paraphoma chrysanthemicola]